MRHNGMVRVFDSSMQFLRSSDRLILAFLFIPIAQRLRKNIT